jgi:hypothetical protein
MLGWTSWISCKKNLSYQLEAFGWVSLQIPFLSEPGAPGTQRAQVAVHRTGRKPAALLQEDTIAHQRHRGENRQLQGALLGFVIPSQETLDRAFIAADRPMARSAACNSSIQSENTASGVGNAGEVKGRLDPSERLSMFFHLFFSAVRSIAHRCI